MKETNGHDCPDFQAARTFDVGYVHVLTEHGGPCVGSCPHPDHHPLSEEDA